LRTLFSLVLFTALVATSSSGAVNEKAPLPDRVVAAKTAFLLNDNVEPKLNDAFYTRLKKWNHWQIVTDREQADLILVLSQRDSVVGALATASGTASGQTASGTAISAPIVASSWFLYVVDARTGETSWKVRVTGGAKLWITWNSIADKLLSDIQTRLK
jgi:hypothetical protein